MMKMGEVFTLRNHFTPISWKDCFASGSVSFHTDNLHHYHSHHQGRGHVIHCVVVP